MKKLLLTGVAAGGLLLSYNTAQAEEVDVSGPAPLNIELGGYFKGYAALIDQDEIGANDVNEFDFLRDTEIHITSEMTLDNGLTIGTSFEFDVDGEDGDAEVDESFVYFSGDFGLVNFGNEDGVGYLLQVAAPSADSNVDGIRQYIDANNFTAAGIVPFSTGLDYDMDPFAKIDRISYISPSFSGFQAGVSFAPDNDDAESFSVGTEGASVDESYEIAARYERAFNGVELITGAGYAHGENNSTAASADDRKAWNIGLDLSYQNFGIGTIYTEDNNAMQNQDTDTFVVGADYRTGPFKLGVSYLDLETEGVTDVNRYSGGVIYNVGPGIDTRASLHRTEVDPNGGSEYESTSLIIGTVVNF